jgi:hypothetical protein
MVRGIVSFGQGLPPVNDPYAFDLHALQMELEKLLR